MLDVGITQGVCHVIYIFFGHLFKGISMCNDKKV